MNEYEKQAQYLTENPHEIQDHWQRSRGMFSHCSKDRHSAPADIPGKFCGCLTQIRKSVMYSSGNKSQDAEIRMDSRIPDNQESITPDMFPAFIEWQMKLDLDIPNRIPYVFQAS